MKRILLFLLCCSCFCSSVWATSLSEKKIHRVAVDACSQVAATDFSTKKYEVKPVSYEGEVCYYVVQFQPEGWALVSADEKAAPVFGYSDKGVFDLEQMSDANRLWLNERASELKAIKGNLALNAHSGWDGSQLRAGSYDKIAPMIQVSWNQKGQFAQSCPVNTEGKRALVGCLAVAIAQALTVEQYPVQPTGVIGYTDNDFGLIKVNFDKEAPYDWKLILSGEDDKKELSRFLYHCGVIVQMDYGVDGSGAYSRDVPKALKTYFSFSDSVKCYSKGSYSGDWKELILKELNAGRAVIYSGHDPDGNYGHAFNLDGFDGSNSFHVNWGWGGKNNGYFSLDNLHDGTFGYRESHQVVVGLIPKQQATEVENVAVPTVQIYASSTAVVVSAEEKGTCWVYDLAGKLVLSRPIEAGMTTLSGIEKGIYIVCVQAGNQKVTYKIKR